MGDWLALIIKSQEMPGLVSPLGDPMPAFPDATLQRNTTGLEGELAIRQAFYFYEDIHCALQACGTELDRASRVLDFGVGWGRIARCFLRDVSLENLSGIDVDGDFVALCERLFSAPRFQVCKPLPPTELPQEQFDLVSAYSVFSHLSEAACLAWVREFARILRPGGFFAFTTRGEGFFDYCAWAAVREPRAEASSPKGDDDYLRALGALFPHIEDARSRYRAGELVHQTSPGVSGGGPRTEAFYGETAIPAEYLKQTYGEHFELVFERSEPERYDQAFFVLRKR